MDLTVTGVRVIDFRARGASADGAASIQHGEEFLERERVQVRIRDAPVPAATRVPIFANPVPDR